MLYHYNSWHCSVILSTDNIIIQTERLINYTKLRCNLMIYIFFSFMILKHIYITISAERSKNLNFQSFSAEMIIKFVNLFLFLCLFALPCKELILGSCTCKIYIKENSPGSESANRWELKTGKWLLSSLW